MGSSTESGPAGPGAAAGGHRSPGDETVDDVGGGTGAQPRRRWRILAGVLSAAGALGTGQLVAALLSPESSPLVAVGSVLVDGAPTPVKTAAVRALGTADKPVLIAAVALMLGLFAALLGLVAWRRRKLALAGTALLGLVGLVAVLVRAGEPVNVVAPLTTLVVAVGALAAFTKVRNGQPGASSTARETADQILPTRPHPPMMARSAPAELRRPSRRAVLGGAGLAGLAVLGGASGKFPAPARGISATLPSPKFPAAPVPAGAQVPGAVPFITPNADFYRVDIALITPRVDVENWQLVIDGAVDKPLTLNYSDLLALPMIERTITMACVSNEVGGPYVSTARWLGVSFRTLIDLVGVRPGVDQCFSHSLDGGYTCSTPYGPLSDGRDAMVAVAMNGEPLPDKNGFPARMVVPGLFGFVSATKWISRLEFTTYAEKSAYWTDREWATDAPVLTQSRIDSPASLDTLAPDNKVIAGTAWATHRGISKVEVRIDDGQWLPAILGESASEDVWRQWSLRYDGPPGRHTAEVRAVDGDGDVQPERRTTVFPSGATGWHTIQFTVD